MATGTRAGVLPGTALVSVPGPLFEFADALHEIDSDLVSDRLMAAFASGRRGRAPKGYGMHIIADRELVAELRTLANAVGSGGLNPEEATVLSEMDVNLKAGSRRFLNRTLHMRYASPSRTSPEGDDQEEDDSAEAQEKSKDFTAELEASLREQGIEPDDLTDDEKAALAAEGTGTTEPDEEQPEDTTEEDTESTEETPTEEPAPADAEEGEQETEGQPETSEQA